LNTKSSKYSKIETRDAEAAFITKNERIAPEQARGKLCKERCYANIGWYHFFSQSFQFCTKWGKTI